MKPEPGIATPDPMKRLGWTALYIWIAGTAFFFFLRFSLVFLHANAGAIRHMLDGGL